MKKFAYLLQSLVTFVIIVLLLGMGYLNRDLLWKQTKVARAFYFVWQGDENIKANNFQAAIDFYKTALKIYPEHSKAHYNLGNIYFWYEVYTASPIRQPTKTFRYNPDLNKFVLIVEPPSGDEDLETSAEAAYIKATEVNPNFINAWVNLGLVRLNNYNLDGSIEAFTKAINANPIIVNIPFIYNNEGSIKFNRSVAYYNLARVYDEMAYSTDYDEIREEYLIQSMRYYKKSLEIYNQSYDTNYNLALTYQQLRRDTPAIDHYCSAIKLEPLKYPAHYNLGVLLKRQERYTSSAAEIKKAAMLIDYGTDTTKAEYVFRILTDVSYRSAAQELSRIRELRQTTYPMPKTGIIAEVLGEPMLEEQEKLKQEQQKEKQEEETEDSNMGSMASVKKYFSTCVTDTNYFEKEKEKFEIEPDWIKTNKEYIDQITDISINSLSNSNQ